MSSSDSFIVRGSRTAGPDGDRFMIVVEQGTDGVAGMGSTPAEAALGLAGLLDRRYRMAIPSSVHCQEIGKLNKQLADVKDQNERLQGEAGVLRIRVKELEEFRCKLTSLNEKLVCEVAELERAKSDHRTAYQQLHEKCNKEIRAKNVELNRTTEEKKHFASVAADLEARNCRQFETIAELRTKLVELDKAATKDNEALRQMNGNLEQERVALSVENARLRKQLEQSLSPVRTGPHTRPAPDSSHHLGARVVYHCVQDVSPATPFAAKDASDQARNRDGSVETFGH